MKGLSLMGMIIMPTAPIPAVVPTYNVVCNGGEMTGRKIRIAVAAGGLAGSRVAKVSEDGKVLDVAAKLEPLIYTEAIAGNGFIEVLDFRRGEERTIARLWVRGQVEDDLITFTAMRGPAKPVFSPKNFSGACHSIGGKQGIMQ